MYFSTIQMISLVGSVVFIGLILWSVRQKKLKEAYAILWLLVGIIMTVFSINLKLLHGISSLMGIQYPPAALFLLLLCGVIAILFQYAQLLSKNQERISRLTQEIALLKQELALLKEKLDRK